MVDVDTIAQALAPAVSELGLELYDVDVSGSGRARILRVMVDRDGGVDLDAIADATQAVSPLLDACAERLPGAEPRAGDYRFDSTAASWASTPPRSPSRASPSSSGRPPGPPTPASWRLYPQLDAE